MEAELVQFLTVKAIYRCLDVILPNLMTCGIMAAISIAGLVWVSNRPAKQEGNSDER